MPITISCENGFISVSSSFDKELDMSPLEEEFSKIIISLISDSVDASKIRLERRSDAYVSMFYGEHNDFLRFKLSEKTKWISIRMSKDDQLENIDNPLFSAQKNKKQFHWKSQIMDIEDFSIYKPFLVNACLDNF